MSRLWLWALSLGLMIVPAVVLGQTDDENDPAAVTAKAHFTANAVTYGLTNPAMEMRVRSVRAGRLLRHVRFNQIFQGVPVYGGEAIAHVDGQGNVWVNNAIRPNLSVDVTPAIARQTAVHLAALRAGIRGSYETQLAELRVVPTMEWNPAPALAWHVRVYAENLQDIAKQWDVFVNAKTGGIIFAFDSLHSIEPAGASLALLQGNTMWNGQVNMLGLLLNGQYYLYNARLAGLNTRDLDHARSGNGQIVSRATPVFGDGDKANTDSATAAADAQFAAVATWAYYASTFSRNGIDNAGRQTFSRVHYGTRYENAFWNDSCFCMTYGDGSMTFYSLTSLDVGGHEMSHGVMASEANLQYTGESGGLNESNSDIFGTMVEFFVNSLADTPDYWVGERIFRANWPTPTTYVQTQALRYMDDPHKDGASPACWSSNIGKMDVHYSSGPNNHMFYLLAEGGSSKCNGQVVTGIGRPAASAIWYNAVTNYMTSTTNYAAARTAALDSATELYGAGSAEYSAVAAAYSAINRN